jgi:hypothetical protein
MNWGGVGGHGCGRKWCQNASCSKVFPCVPKGKIVKQTFMNWKIMVEKMD